MNKNFNNLVYAILILVIIIIGILLMQKQPEEQPLQKELKNLAFQYQNTEIKIDFGAEILEVAPTITGDENYFNNFAKQVKFCKYQAQAEDVQQVIPAEDSYLCEMRELEAMAVDEVRKIVPESFDLTISLSSLSEPEEKLLGDFTVLKWRYQTGKTRLDHFLVFGEKHNYLFVSSPYGDHGEIEQIISNAQLLQ